MMIVLDGRLFQTGVLNGLDSVGDDDHGVVLIKVFDDSFSIFN